MSLRCCDSVEEADNRIAAAASSQHFDTMNQLELPNSSKIQPKVRNQTDFNHWMFHHVSRICFCFKSQQLQQNIKLCRATE